MTDKDTHDETIPAELLGEEDLGEHRFLEFVERHKASVLVAVIAAAGILAALSIWRSSAQADQEAASRLLTEATSAEQLQEVIDAFPKSPAAPAALLAVAKDHYRTRDYAAARDAYDQFITNYAGHEFVLIAKLGRVVCSEEMGDAETALKGFTEFTTAHPDHFLTAQAILGRARCMEAGGQLAEARVVYEDFVAASGEGPWSTLAEESLARVNCAIDRESGTL